MQRKSCKKTTAPFFTTPSLHLFVITAAISLFSQTARNRPEARPREYTYTVVQSLPHDPDAFTQGLVYHDGFLYEGTGLQGRSSLRKVRLETGEVLQRVDLPYEYFGEGIAIVRNEILQLTWKSDLSMTCTAFVRSASSLIRVKAGG